MARLLISSKCVRHDLHVAQIEYLSQELIEHMRNAYNLFGRGTSELEKAQRALTMLVTIQDQWMNERDLNSEQR